MYSFVLCIVYDYYVFSIQNYPLGLRMAHVLQSYARGTQYPHLSLVERVCSKKSEENMVMVMSNKVGWQDFYKSAILELNPMELRNKVELARTAMNQHLEELRLGADANSIDEQRAIGDALKNLGALERFELKSPISEGSQSSELTWRQA
jgi:hypothetical protein